MKKEILILGIIFLIIGVGIQPAFAVETSYVRQSGNMDDCNCKVDDNYNIVRVESLLNRAERLLHRVEIYTKVIPILFKDNPEVLEHFEELNKRIITFREMNEELKTDSPSQYPYIICNFLEKTFEPIAIIASILSQIMETSIIMHLFLLPIFIPIYILGISNVIIYIILNCAGP